MTNTNMDVLNPAFDYIPPDLVSLYITNVYVFNSLTTNLSRGCYIPSYIYRLLAEYYDPDDNNLD